LPKRMTAEDTWTENVLSAIAPLRGQADTIYATLADETAEDFQALLQAESRLRSLQDTAGSDARHDRRNLVGAIRGYAEMLEEQTQGLPDILRHIIPDILRAATSEPTATQADNDPIAGTALSHVEEPGVILAVDDLPENRDLVCRQLRKTGHTVITAESGEEALEVLGTAAVDVVLLDLVMPGIGGAEVLRRLKDDQRLRATSVIMISGQQDMDQIISCIEAGADDYLLKPFNPVLLQARISAGIERKRWHDREERYREQLERREQFIRATFGRYLSDDIVDEILEKPEGLELGGDLKEVTIMMSDIRGFTSVVEHLPPQDVVKLLNRYLGKMTDIILESGGTIDEFLGDAVLAVFGAPRSRSDDTDRAVQSALAMQSAMTEINAANATDGLPHIEMAIALNTGSVVAGNIGSERRSKYGFVGHAMNVTSRIEDITGPGEILISESTRTRLNNNYTLNEARTLTVKGIEQAIVVHPVTGFTQ